jgi:hypothetical protein
MKILIVVNLYNLEKKQHELRRIASDEMPTEKELKEKLKTSLDFEYTYIGIVTFSEVSNESYEKLLGGGADG